MQNQQQSLQDFKKKKKGINMKKNEEIFCNFKLKVTGLDSKDNQHQSH